jgi:exopolysaccharide biosynthesis polyprenyl glycosylphosphotransferase
VNLRRALDPAGLFATPAAPAVERGLFDEAAFHRMISLERRRTERSRKPFLLMLLDMGKPMVSQAAAQQAEATLRKIMAALSGSTRETDVAGWYRHDAVVGVMFTEIGLEQRDSIVSTMIARLSNTLRHDLSFEQFAQLSISFHVYPEHWDHELPQRPSNPALYPDLSREAEAKRFPSGLKRAMDIAGSALALVLASPLFLAIAVAIKATSKGPVFFRQRRIGQHGTPFVFLKFRSMYTGNDASTHKEYVRQLIAGKAQRHDNGNGEGVFKLTQDPRITRVGNFLRRTSLDELPQFINVLRGEMSLVGPRPPVPYEVEAYDFWHRRRLLEAKPGITGLWQVSGRSRVKFDDMVRLDLRYARTWSPWMDVKILLRTPGAVVLGEGAH